MPNNATIKGDNTVLFGSAGLYGNATAGFITGGNKKTTGDKLEVRDETGFVVAIIYFNGMNQFSFEMIVRTAAPTLARGDVITVAGIAGCVVDDTEEIWAAQDVRKYRVNATKYSGATVT